MTDGFDHNQLATVSRMDVTYDRESGEFTLAREFDLSRSPHLDAEAVAASWREALDAGAIGVPEPDLAVSGERLVLKFHAHGVDTRHDLKPQLGLLCSEMISMVGAHDGEQAVGLATQMLDVAEKMRDMGEG